MTTDLDPAASSLPAVRKLFDELKSGRHWSFGDEVYPELVSDRFQEYVSYFSRIGINLQADPRGFYFATLDRDDELNIVSKTATSFVLFSAIWIEALADRGLNIHAEIFQKEHRSDSLPHFSAENHRRLMAEAGMSTLEDLERLLGAFNRLGFISLIENGTFQVRLPFHRLLDVCQEYGRAADQPASEPDDTLSDGAGGDMEEPIQ